MSEIEQPDIRCANCGEWVPVDETAVDFRDRVVCDGCCGREVSAETERGDTDE